MILMSIWWNLKLISQYKRIQIHQYSAYIRSSLDWPWACCRFSCANIIRLYCTSWRASKSSSIWQESGLKQISPGSKKHMLIRSIDVRIRTKWDHFWISSVLVGTTSSKDTWTEIWGNGKRSMAISEII